MNITFFKSKLLAAVAGLVLAGSANANLIVNGGFEDNLVPSGSWNYYSSSDVNGWEGSNIEVWNNLGGVSAAEGQQHAELNAHPYTGEVFSIFQDFATVIGQSYDVSFFYRARASEDEVFAFSVGSLNAILADHTVNAWSRFSDSFIADSELTRLSFTTLDSGTLGNLIDGVSVEATVPEPASVALLAIGLFGLGLARRNLRA
ncbi:MAG TPA: PEP-CTERM sorting domain-containing protein [Cellvibrio sp.]|nr:PEP-CTERM sorting domain-containing protein [Cellvibrio sp.]